MIRVLFMIAAAGFVLSVATIATAVAIGGPELVARGGWTMFSSDWDDGHWSWGHHGRRFHRHGYWEGDHGPQSTRTLAWSGAQGLDVDLPADVRYIQDAGQGSVTVTGPEDAVTHVVVRGNSITYDDDRSRHWPRKVEIVVRAPAINSFDLSGDNELVIEGYRQDTLSMDVSGSGNAIARGEVGTINLDISGAGDVDMGGLKAKGADVDISGAGDVTIAPTDWAKLKVSGMGDVRLLSHPAKLETDVTGAGKVRQDSSASASPSPSRSPSASPSPPTLPKKKT